MTDKKWESGEVARRKAVLHETSSWIWNVNESPIRVDLQCLSYCLKVYAYIRYFEINVWLWETEQNHTVLQQRCSFFKKKKRKERKYVQVLQLKETEETEYKPGWHEKIILNVAFYHLSLLLLLLFQLDLQGNYIMPFSCVLVGVFF